MPGTPSTADPSDLVESFADSGTRFQAFCALRSLGPEALPAVRQGLEHANWHVRHWCAIFLDDHGDLDSLRSLLPLLHDPVSKVRLWAVHSISCEHCKACENPIDVVPLLIDRIENDDNKRVRKMAVAMLGLLPPDARAVPVLQTLLREGQDEKTRLHAGRGLQRCRDAGLTVA